MAKVYLSPSVQDYNEYITGGNEEFYMNSIADAMVPYLRENAIDFVRNNPGDSLKQSVEKSKAENCDLHMALHSNSSPENLSGLLQGPDIYYYSFSGEGERAANVFAKNLSNLYTKKDLVAVIPNETLGELKNTECPSVLVELAYHDNYEDANWIVNNVNSIARTLAYSIVEYFGGSFSEDTQEELKRG